MSHNIEFNRIRGTSSFFSRKERAWHGLGQTVEEALTSEQAIKLANLDFEVEKRECFIKPNPNNDIFLRQVPNTFALMRTDTQQILTKPGKTVTSVYEVVQNVEAFQFFDNIVGSKQAIFETAGVLGNGERIFITAKLPTTIRMIGTDDIIEKYLLLTSSHDGAGAIEAMLTPIRVVCNNTLNLALKSCTNKISMRHTTNVRDRLSQGAQLMGMYKVYDAEFQDVVGHLAQQQLTSDEIIDTVGQLVFTSGEMELWRKRDYTLYKVPEISVRKKNQFDTLINAVDQGVGQDSYRGSKLWILNGVSTFLNNVKDYKSEAQKFEYVMYSGGQQFLQKTLNLVLAK